MSKEDNGIFIPDTVSNYDFNDGFKFCCGMLKKRVREDFDAVIAITGEEGVSKSTLANWVGMKTDKYYTLEKNCLFSPSPKSLVDSVRNLPRFSAVNADEAVKILYKQQWWLQTFINKFYRLCRQDNKISIMCMPRFNEFNEGFRNHRILIWIHIFGRGIGVAFQKDWSPFVKDPWHFDDNQKMIASRGKHLKYYNFKMEDKMRILEKSPNFIGTVTFPNLPEDFVVKYKEMAKQHKYEGLEEEFDQGKRYMTMKKRMEERLNKLIAVFKTETGLSQEEIGRRIGVSGSTLSVMKNIEDEIDDK